MENATWQQILMFSISWNRIYFPEMKILSGIVFMLWPLCQQGRLPRQALPDRVLAGSDQQTSRPHRLHQGEGRGVRAGRVPAGCGGGLGVPAAVPLRSSSAGCRGKEVENLASSMMGNLRSLWWKPFYQMSWNHVWLNELYNLKSKCIMKQRVCVWSEVVYCAVVLFKWLTVRGIIHRNCCPAATSTSNVEI